MRLALEEPELSPRELAVRFTDTECYFVSEAGVYRLLKAHDLITSPAFVVIKAADEFRDKTMAPNQLWQTDFTYLKVIGWGWFYLSTILDDFSRHIIAWKLCTTMKAVDVTDTLEMALEASGRVDTVYRKYKTTARAAVRQFGEGEVTQRISKLYTDDPYAEVELLHVVMPREDRDARKRNKRNKPWASIHLDPEEKEVIGEHGYDEFPYCVPRFLKASFEIGYGRSPAMSALPDVKMVNKMSEVVIRASQLQIHPPLMVPDDGFMLPVRTTPGGLNFYRSGTRDRIEPLNIGANNPLGEMQLEQRRQAIRAAFYVDQLILGTGPQMTATEVIQRTEEKMRLLGPVLGRLQAELLQPLIGRVFNLLARQKAFPPAPDMVQTGSIDIEYVSPIARAQRSGDVQGILQMLEFLMPLVQLDQGIVDWLDMDGLAKHIIKVTGSPAAVVRGEGEVRRAREQRAQEAQAQAEMAAIQQMASAAGDAAPALRAVDDAAGPGGLAAIAGGPAG